MKTLEDLQNIIDDISAGPMNIHVGETNEVPWLQVTFHAADCVTKKMELQKCRKWMLSYHMVTSEVVRTAYKALEAAVLHELGELFTYRGVRVYNPHYAVDALVESPVAMDTREKPYNKKG